MIRHAMIVEDWALRLAEAVSPDEAILAPTMADAFIAGGKRRKRLFEETSGVLGGIGAGHFVLIMPAMLSAIAAVGPLLIAALGSPLAGNAVDALDNCIKLLTIREENRNPKTTATAAVIPDDPELAPLLQVLDTMQAELRARGISAETSEAAAYRSLRAFFADPPGATEFVQAVAA